MNRQENLRRSYRPDRITTLFVGESAPHGGTFFYDQNSGLFREMRKAFKGGDTFLEDFKRSGFYLDDLVPTPVNHLPLSDRISLLNQSISSFTKRLKNYRPEAIVILLMSIRPMIIKAISEAGLPYEPYWTPYPGFGNQPRFHKAMTKIIPNLPVARTQRQTEGIHVLSNEINSVAKVAASLLLGAACMAQAPRPKDGYVPDEKTAIQIAKAVVTPMIGEAGVKFQEPFHAELQGTV
jgi:hypothetical protein